MKKQLKYLFCKKCGNLAELVQDSGAIMVCCDEPMTVLTANTSDGASEKHVPVATCEGNKVHVEVGSVLHPMTEAHLITWIAIQTEQGMQLKNLTATDAPVADFVLTDDDKLLRVYEYCNLHGLWLYEVQ